MKKHILKTIKRISRNLYGRKPGVVFKDKKKYCRKQKHKKELEE